MKLPGFPLRGARESSFPIEVVEAPRGVPTMPSASWATEGSLPGVWVPLRAPIPLLLMARTSVSLRGSIVTMGWWAPPVRRRAVKVTGRRNMARVAPVEGQRPMRAWGSMWGTMRGHPVLNWRWPVWTGWRRPPSAPVRILRVWPEVILVLWCPVSLWSLPGFSH